MKMRWKKERYYGPIDCVVTDTFKERLKWVGENEVGDTFSWKQQKASRILLQRSRVERWKERGNTCGQQTDW